MLAITTNSINKTDTVLQDERKFILYYSYSSYDIMRVMIVKIKLITKMFTARIAKSMLREGAMG